MRQNKITNRCFPSVSHNITSVLEPKCYETPAENANPQKRASATEVLWHLRRGPLCSKSLKVALCYETIMRRVVVLEGLPFQEQYGLGLKERVAVTIAGVAEAESRW